MKLWHVVAVAIVFYFLGTYFGNFGKSAVSTISNAVS